MTWPSAATKVHMDQASDDPKQARAELADLVDQFNLLQAHVSSYMQGVLDDADAATARATLSAAEDVNFTGSDGGGSPDAGLAGLVPAPASGDGNANKYLHARGGWEPINALSIVEQVYAEDTTYTSSATAIPTDNTIPQNTEGKEIITVSITPTNTNHILVIEGMVNASRGAGTSEVTAAIFQDSTADALASSIGFHDGVSSAGTVTASHYIHHRMTAGTTSSTTFKLRAGGTAGTTYFNGDSSAQVHNAKLKNWIKVTEVAI